MTFKAKGAEQMQLAERLSQPQCQVVQASAPARSRRHGGLHYCQENLRTCLASLYLRTPCQNRQFPLKNCQPAALFFACHEGIASMSSVDELSPVERPVKPMAGSLAVAPVMALPLKALTGQRT